MATAVNSALEQFRWETQPAAARWVSDVIERFAVDNPIIARLGHLLRDNTGTRLVDWVDHLALDSQQKQLERELSDVGFVADSSDVSAIWRHPRGIFPTVVLGSGRIGLGIRVDSVEVGLERLPGWLEIANPADSQIIGEYGSPFRMARLVSRNGVELWLVERHGHQGFEEVKPRSGQVSAASRHLEAFRRRERRFAVPADGFRQASELFAAAANDLGTAWACAVFFQAEREYWQSRNRAGRVQYERQDRLGLGWANHDHHTYRSSRASFTHLIATLEQMGFQCRERFYAGSEAGWGAQVLEQPDCQLVIFADVDLSPEELSGDFAHEPLPQREHLGTVGLWCALHGEAFLEAGMHHLECQFDFDAARTQLAQEGIETMAPFTNFPFLRQAFTNGEMWPVDPPRIDRLVAEGRITAEQAERFRREGALGSHLEILERNEGYKGFNQTGVSDIISRTDPRRVIGA